MGYGNALFDLSEVKGQFFELDYIFRLLSRILGEKLHGSSSAALAKRINFFICELIYLF